jgi:fumarate reductase flavoprotein subunit
MSFEFSVPVIVAGAGAAGLSAALAARGAGAEVLILERDAAPGGTTAMSQGNICAAGTRSQAQHGEADHPDILYADIIAKTRGLTDPELARAIADAAGPTVDWMVEAHDMPWELDLKFKASFGHSRRRVHSWLGRGGADMVQLFAARAEAAGVDLYTQARLIDLHVGADGRVEGAAVQRPDGSVEHIGCAALVLATCGFAANPAMVRDHIPEAAGAAVHTHAGNEGDGILLGAKAGGALADMAAYQGYGMLAVGYGITTPPSVLVEGGIAINMRGERFCHELEDISGMVRHTLAQPDGIAWVVYDARIEAAASYIPEMAQFIALSAAKTADTIEALASACGLPADRLARTLAACGQAPDPFARSFETGPPPAGPYRALKVTGALYHTQGGLQVDAQAQVLRPDGRALANLFAAGGAARGVSGPSSWGYLPAMGLCSAVTLGRRAGEAAARLASRQ